MAVSVYRFRDYAALNAGQATTYITPEDARRIARTLYGIARNIESERFANSPSLTATVPTHDSYSLTERNR